MPAFSTAMETENDVIRENAGISSTHLTPLPKIQIYRSRANLYNIV